MAEAPWYRVIPGGFELMIRAVPRAAVSKVAGLHGAELKVQLAAPPADGEANAALLALLSERLGLKKSALALVSGHGHRSKRVRVQGVSEAAIRALAET